MNIENRFKKQQFLEFAKLNPDAPVRMWVLPKGALCRITDKDGINVLQNGGNSICSSSIVDAMAEHGIKGIVVVDSTTNNAPTIPRWVQFYFTEKTYEDVCNSPQDIVVTTLGILPIKEGLPFVVKSTTPMEVKASEVASVTRRLSSSDSTIDLFLLEDGLGNCYQYEPQRSIDGVILAYTELGYVVSFRNGETVQLVSRVNISTRNALMQLGVSPKDAVGMAVKVQYTSFMGTGRIKPYKAAMISCIYSFARMVGHTLVTDLDSKPELMEYIFKVNRPAYSSVITPTRLADANHFVASDGVYFYDKFGGRLIATLKRGKIEGMPSVVAEHLEDGEDVYYFESEYDNDSLMYKSFITVISRALYDKAGFKINRTGIYYLLNGVEMLGNVPLEQNSQMPLVEHLETLQDHINK